LIKRAGKNKERHEFHELTRKKHKQKNLSITPRRRERSPDKRRRGQEGEDYYKELLKKVQLKMN
jgi:hypothetical protein